MRFTVQHCITFQDNRRMKKTLIKEVIMLNVIVDCDIHKAGLGGEGGGAKKAIMTRRV